MHTNHGPRPDPLTDLGYEPKDVNMRKIGQATAIFFVFFFVMVIATYGIIRLMAPTYFEQRADVPQLTKRIPPAPNPLLQTDVTVRTDIQDLRRNEDEVLHGAGWTDPGKSVAHIPIDRAMEIIAQRGGDTKPTSGAPESTTPESSTTAVGGATTAAPATTAPANQTGGHGG